MDNNNSSCGFKNGLLPPCAPLAVPYVPPQQSAKPAYGNNEALSRGTLFPGLDLPFMNVVNATGKADTPLRELMALKFVAHELRLYLDTHADDQEAFETLQEILKLSAEANRRYAKKYGPVNAMDLIDAKNYTWIDDPWPWDYNGPEV